MVGEVAKQPCPGGASGLARWKCVGNEQNNNLPTWFPESTDLSDCKSAWLLSLQVRRKNIFRNYVLYLIYDVITRIPYRFHLRKKLKSLVLVQNRKAKKERIIIHMFVITMSTGKSVGGRQNIQRCK